MESVKTKMEQEFGGTIMSFVVSYGKDTKIIKNRERKTPSPVYILENQNEIIIGDFFHSTEYEILSGGGGSRIQRFWINIMRQ